MRSSVVVVLLVLVNILTAFSSVGVYGQEPPQYYRVHTALVGVKGLGVFRNYVIGLSSTASSTNIVAVNLFTAEVRTLAYAESVGLDHTSAKYYEIGDFFAVTDGKIILIWDKDLRPVGRFAGDNIRGFSILPSGNLVVWGKDYVALSSAPYYVRFRFFDVWEQFFKFFNASTIKPEDWLYTLTWINASVEIIGMWLKLYEMAESLNGTVVYANASVYYDIWAPTVSEAKQKLDVDVASAILLSDGSVFIAANVAVPITIRLVGIIMYSPEKGKIKFQEVDLKNTYTPRAGVLASLGVLNISEIYELIEGSAVGPAMIYTYKPLINYSLKGRVLMVLHEDGRSERTPLYLGGRATDIYLVGNTTIVKLDTDVALVYRGTTLLWSFRASKIVDVGEVPGGKIYVVYINTLGAYEIGYVNVYSGRAGKMVVDLPSQLVGISLSDDEKYLAVASVIDEQNTELQIHTLYNTVAKVRINIVDVNGNVVTPIVWGRITVSSGPLKYAVTVTDNPFIIDVPTPASLDVVVHVPYGRACEKIDVLKPTEQIYDVFVLITPSPNYIERGSTAPYTNPFFLDHVLIRDTEILKYVLPGAKALDSYGAYIAVLQDAATHYPSVVSLHRVTGEVIWSKTVNSYATDVRIYYPYVIVSGPTELHVLDILSGASRGVVVMLVDGYDVDLESEYVSAWNQRNIAILDLRRGSVNFVDMTPHGAVQAAPIVGGSIFAYVRRGDVINVYVINPIGKGVVEILPLGAQAITGFASDGYFKAVSYIIGESRYTSILSTANGLVVLPAGPVVSIKSLGRVVSLPPASTLYGNSFGVVVVSEDTAYSFYAIGMNYVKLFSVEGTAPENLRFGTSFIVERVMAENVTPVLILRDFSGVPRVTMLLSITPIVFTVSDQMVIYSDKNMTYVIPNPRVMGRYLLSVRVQDAESGTYIDANISIKEYKVSVEAKGGHFKSYLSLPGTLTLTASAPFYHDETVTVELSDENPVASLSIPLRPQLFSISLKVSTPDGETVREGVVTVMRKEPPYQATIDLSKTNKIEKLRIGNYSILYTSDVFTQAEAHIELLSDTTVELTVNRTSIRTYFRVLDEAGRPIERAQVSLALEPARVMELTTNKSGETQVVMVPYKSIFNYTISAKGYSTRRGSQLADLAIDGRPITVTLPKFKGTLVIMVRDETGKPVRATVTVRDFLGNDVIPAITVVDTYTTELIVGTYTVIGVTPDGRTSQTVATISEEMPSAVAILSFPTPPQPLHVIYFPYILIVVIVSTVVVAIIRRLRKKKPKIVA